MASLKEIKAVSYYVFYVCHIINAQNLYILLAVECYQHFFSDAIKM